MSQEHDLSASEGGHMSSTSGRINRVRGVELAYVVTLEHHDSEATEHGFRTMREAEAFIKRNTPVPGALLARTYDRPPTEAGGSGIGMEGIMNDEGILARLKVIDERLRQMSAEEAATVLAGGLESAGIRGPERARLLEETERILDQLDGTTDD